MSGLRRCLCLVIIFSILLCGCGSSVPFAFRTQEKNSNYSFLVSESGSVDVARPFSENLCVLPADAEFAALDGISEETACALFDVNGLRTVYAQRVHERIYPASLTKIMTALIALENANPDAVLTASSNVLMTDLDAVVIGLKPGDTMTLSQALYILLLYSANDVAVLIAENIGGTMAGFIQMMNDEAVRLGATNTNFINSNGLSDINHYTTAYDLYLIFKEALQFDTFNEIIAVNHYSTYYHDQYGNQKEATVNSTNLYLTGAVSPPSGVTVIGGKTGTTQAAGSCLIVLARNAAGSPYIGVVMKADGATALYQQMNILLGQII